jgi:hypothetical protein
MDKFEFNPDISLDRAEQSSLASIIAQPGFAVVQKIGKSCVDSFVVAWINKEQDEDVLRAHRHAKVAAQFYTMLIQRIKDEVDEYIHTQPQEKPLDVAQSLDIGEYIQNNYDEKEEEPFI